MLDREQVTLVSITPWLLSFLVLWLLVHHIRLLEVKLQLFLYQVGQRADGVCHDGQDIVEGLPGLGQLEDSEKPEGSQDREAADAVGKKFHEREQDDDEVEDVPAVLQEEVFL